MYNFNPGIKMKTLFLFLLFSLIFMVACSEEEKQLEITNTEAFAYSLDEGWELNSSVNVSGFQQNEEEGQYSAKLSYSFHLVTPESDTLYEADYGYIDKHEKEKMMDIQIDSQMEIDSSFSTGEYQIVFEITDDYSMKTISAVNKFELTAE